MFFIFGWAKEAKPVRPVVDCYCYRCHRQKRWDLWRETEWVSFFMVKIVPFLWKRFLVCSGCNAFIPMDKARYREIRDGRTSPALHTYLESYQLQSKSEIQRNFLRAQREQNENRR